MALLLMGSLAAPLNPEQTANFRSQSIVDCYLTPRSAVQKHPSYRNESTKNCCLPGRQASGHFDPFAPPAGLASSTQSDWDQRPSELSSVDGTAGSPI